MIQLKIALLACLFMLSNQALIGQDKRSVDDAEGLMIGDTAPNFTAIDQVDEEFELYQELENGPVVLIFYRGQWCPVCNRHLSYIQDSLDLILEKGASLVAVSPELGNLLEKTASRTGATFSLLHDEDYKISTAYDVIFDPTGLQKTLYNTFTSANLKEAHSDDSQRLPIPATFIIGQEGKIIWRQFDPNYKKRASVKAIIDNLPQ